jgi:pyridoxal phosphate enzyme (YggS family)
MDETAAKLQDVLDDIASAAKEAGRAPGDIGLVAVSKTHDAARVSTVLQAGHRQFGENRVQEAAGKWPQLREEFSDVKLHLIGPLQTNKVRLAFELFDVIETVDRPKLARAIAREADKAGRMPDCLIQVNTGAEAQKAGVMPDEADDFIEGCRTEYGLPITGLMCIPPVDEEPSLHFALLREMARRNGLAQLSMGMSSDYRVAIAFGATLVRVGTAIFGARQAYTKAR